MEIETIISELYAIPIVLMIVLIPSVLYLVALRDIAYRRNCNSMFYVLLSLLLILPFWEYWLKFWGATNFLLKFFDAQVDPVVAYLAFAFPCILILTTSIVLYSRPSVAICLCR